MQAPLVSLGCPPHESGQYDYPDPEYCAAFRVLLIRSLWDLRVGTGWFLHHYREDVNALSTVAIALFTATLWWTTRRQLSHLSQSLELARSEFVSSHRPKIRVRFIRTDWPKANERPAAKLEAANIGETTATIVRIGVDIFRYGRHLGTPDGWSAIPAPISPHLRVEPGQQADFNVLGRQTLTDKHIQLMTDQQETLGLIALIEYVDDNGVMRLTSVARRYDLRWGRYTKMGPDDLFADYEYED